MKNVIKLASVILAVASLAGCSSEASKIDKCEKELHISRDTCALKVQQESAESAANWRWAASEGMASTRAK